MSEAKSTLNATSADLLNIRTVLVEAGSRYDYSNYPALRAVLVKLAVGAALGALDQGVVALHDLIAAHSDARNLLFGALSATREALDTRDEHAFAFDHFNTTDGLRYAFRYESGPRRYVGSFLHGAEVAARGDSRTHISTFNELPLSLYGLLGEASVAPDAYQDVENALGAVMDAYQAFVAADEIYSAVKFAAVTVGLAATGASEAALAECGETPES